MKLWIKSQVLVDLPNIALSSFIPIRTCRQVFFFWVVSNAVGLVLVTMECGSGTSGGSGGIGFGLGGRLGVFSMLRVLDMLGAGGGGGGHSE